VEGQDTPTQESIAPPLTGEVHSTEPLAVSAEHFAGAGSESTGLDKAVKVDQESQELSLIVKVPHKWVFDIADGEPPEQPHTVIEQRFLDEFEPRIDNWLKLSCCCGQEVGNFN
jgi:hypothetical protein